MAEYRVSVADPFGVVLAQTSEFLSLEYARAVNGVGTLKLAVDPESFDTDLFLVDGRIGVWRQAVAGGAWMLDTETVWLARKFRCGVTDGGPSPPSQSIVGTDRQLLPHPLT